MIVIIDYFVRLWYAMHCSKLFRLCDEFREIYLIFDCFFLILLVITRRFN